MDDSLIRFSEISVVQDVKRYGSSDLKKFISVSADWSVSSISKSKDGSERNNNEYRQLNDSSLSAEPNFSVPS